MIEACMNMCMNLSFCQQGTDIRYLKLHAELQKNFCYYVKHAYRVSTAYNQHSPTNPWHGAGQGAGDACLCWIVQTNSMINAYASKATLWILNSPNYTQTYHQLLDAFIDDTDIFAAQQPCQNFINFMATLQFNLDLWYNLLQASGGVLNPSKCVWLSFTWKFHPSSKLSITQPPPNAQLTTTIHGQPLTPIRLLKPDEAHHYLGVYLRTDTNCDTKLGTFCQQNATYVNLLQTCPFNAMDTQVYKQCYLPMVTYPPPATSMPTECIYKAQQPTTSIFLTKIGYPHSFPQAVVYASPDRGGIGFLHLSHKQGMFFQILLMLSNHNRLI